MHRDPREVFPADLELASVKSDTHLDAQGPDLISDGAAATDPVARAFKDGQEPIPGGLDLAPFEAARLPAHDLSVRQQQVSPVVVAKGGGAHRGVGDVREHHRRQEPAGLGRLRIAPALGRQLLPLSHLERPRVPLRDHAVRPAGGRGVQHFDAPESHCVTVSQLAVGLRQERLLVDESAVCRAEVPDHHCARRAIQAGVPPWRRCGDRRGW